jgi:acetylornithine deacetylase/succinyl-diaminopimelate desuccinylase-like protein
VEPDEYAAKSQLCLKTIVPASATCQLDIRLAPEMTVQDALDKVRAHLDHKGYDDVELCKYLLLKEIT